VKSKRGTKSVRLGGGGKKERCLGKRGVGEKTNLSPMRVKIIETRQSQITGKTIQFWSAILGGFVRLERDRILAH